ncbi:AraC family ligand binding domain-containing protein [Paenibacillus peoriae]|uniref:AraC family ligand binding domain-containing protein n=2 Tax=Paenibacillus peoriae TaxID=59893 RepID=UPI002DBB90B9|nr:AraC family ligand binding domain-containing protein [Paenibacillus peoriae]MEC0180185.1 AraC family ligand binding domain-containing protein [Paenibacillus peoriae]
MCPVQRDIRAHWIQTVSGEGIFTFKGGTFRLGEQSGVLLLPGESHAYRRATKVWRTLYITFDGPIAAAVLTALGLKHTRGYHWDNASMETFFGHMKDDLEYVCNYSRIMGIHQ